jgi:hypothetical protein
MCVTGCTGKKREKHKKENKEKKKPIFLPLSRSSVPLQNISLCDIFGKFLI